MVRITPLNLGNHELIGLRVEVVNSENPLLVGLKGIVIDETKNTIIIFDERKNSPKIIPKDVVDLTFTLPDGTKVLVKGEVLIGSPEDRIKKTIKKRW